MMGNLLWDQQTNQEIMDIIYHACSWYILFHIHQHLIMFKQKGPDNQINFGQNTDT